MFRKMRNDGEGIIETQQQGVAVRLAVRHRLGGDERAAARTVLHDHRPAPLGGKRTRKHAPDHIHGRPGGERHNDAGQPGFLRNTPAGANRYGQSNGTKADQYASAQRHVTVASSRDDARMLRRGRSAHHDRLASRVEGKAAPARQREPLAWYAHSPPGSISLHSAWVRRGTPLAALTRGGGEPAFTPVGVDLDEVTSALELLHRRLGKPGFDDKGTGAGSARPERDREVLGMPSGSINGLLQVHSA